MTTGAILTLGKANGQSFVIKLTDFRDRPLSLTDVDDATLVLRESVGGTDVLVLESGSGLTIQTGPSSLLAEPTNVQLNISTGRYLAQVALHYGTPDLWVDSEIFFVEIVNSIAQHS